MERVARRLVAIYDWTPESAGYTNPHSPQELEEKMQTALATAQRLGYQAARQEAVVPPHKEKTVKNYSC